MTYKYYFESETQAGGIVDMSVLKRSKWGHIGNT